MTRGAVASGRPAALVRVERHRALVRTPAGLRLHSLPTPTPGPGELLLAPEVVGVCGTDLQILRGLRADPAEVLGHEGVARVVAVGPAVAGPAPRVGERVLVDPTHPRDDTFLLGHNVAGLWAERVVVPAAAVRDGLVVRAPGPGPATPAGPDHDAAVVAALAEPLSSVLEGYRVATDVAAGAPSTLVVWGGGVVGRLAVRWWRHRRPDLRVLHVHRPGEPPLLPEPGTLALAADDQDLPAVLVGLTGPVTAVVATPRTASLQAVAALVGLCRAALTIDLHAGLPAGPVRWNGVEDVVDLAALRARNRAGRPVVPVARTVGRRGAAPVTFVGHRGVAPATLQRAAHVVSGDPTAWADLVTHHVTLDDAVRAIRAMVDGDRHVDGRPVLKLAMRISR
jgi:threonine dehydrogenase-like Zn-dependent dehydrogenase